MQDLLYSIQVAPFSIILNNRCPLNAAQRSLFMLSHERVQNATVAVTNPMVMGREIDGLQEEVLLSKVSWYVSTYVSRVKVH